MSEDVINTMHVAHEIQKYLQDHPHAADTLDGISKWWISRIRVEEATLTVSKALEILEREGKIKKTVSVNGKQIYSLFRK